MIYYLICGNWYIWILRPWPYAHMQYGVWTSGYFGDHIKRCKPTPIKRARRNMKGE